MGKIIEKNYYLTARHTNIFKLQKQLEIKSLSVNKHSGLASRLHAAFDLSSIAESST
jgi:hypothetical protein